MKRMGFLVLENGPLFSGLWSSPDVHGSTDFSHNVQDRAGEVVFNTGHSGYEEMATDPSYYKQILVMTAPMQGNYGADAEVWESRKLWIEGFVCLELQQSPRDSFWRQTLQKNNIPALSEVDTRALVLFLRERGTSWGALVQSEKESEAREKGLLLIQKAKKIDSDWVYQVTRDSGEDRKGQNPHGPRVAVLDLGCKENTLRCLEQRCREIRIFPSRTASSEIRAWNPDGLLLSNGPGDPDQVVGAVQTLRDLLGWRPIFGICMGHQLLALALGAKTYRLKYGHRGGNHPIRDDLLKKIYVTSQNHGYAVDRQSLPSEVRVTHTNLNDGTVSGIANDRLRCWGVQFHPESRPGPHEAEILFDYFISQIQ